MLGPRPARSPGSPRNGRAQGAGTREIQPGLGTDGVNAGGGNGTPGVAALPPPLLSGSRRASPPVPIDGSFTTDQPDMRDVRRQDPHHAAALPITPLLLSRFRTLHALAPLTSPLVQFLGRSTAKHEICARRTASEVRSHVRVLSPRRLDLFQQVPCLCFLHLKRAMGGEGGGLPQQF